MSKDRSDIRWDNVSEKLLLKGGVSLISKLVAAVIAFAFTATVARTLPQAEAGYFLYSLSLVTFVATVSRVGLDQAITRFVASADSLGDRLAIGRLYLGSQSLIAGTSAVLALMMHEADFLYSSIQMSSELREALRASSLLLVPMSLTQSQARFFQGRQMVCWFHICQAMGASLVFLMLPGRAETATSASHRLFAGYVVTLIAGTIVWIRGYHRLRNTKPVIASFTLHDVCTAALPLWGVSVLKMADKWLAHFFVGVWCHPGEVATYSIALKVAMQISLVLLSVNSISFPLFATLHAKGDMRGLGSAARKAAGLTFLFCGPIALVVMIWPGEILLFFGSDYVGGALALRILAMSQFINAATGSVTGLLMMTGHERDLVKISVAMALVMTVLSVWLAPRFGLNGVATAHAASLSLTMVICVLVAKQRLGIWPVGLSFRRRDA